MTVDQRAPALFDGRPPTEILIPVVAEYHYERNIAISTQLATLWNLPLRLVHFRLPEAGSSTKALASSVDALKSAHPDLVIDGVEVEADDVAGGILGTSSDRSLLLLGSDNATQWSEQDSVGEATLRQVKDMVLLCGVGCEPVAQPTAIVVPLDGSPRAELALEPAIEVALASRTKLWLVTAVSPATVEAVARRRNAGERVSESAYLRSVADRLAERNINVGWEVTHHDDPVAGVSEVARRLDALLIVAATQGNTGSSKRVFGSVTLGLVERGAVPILVIKTDVEPEPQLSAGGDVADARP